MWSWSRIGQVAALIGGGVACIFIPGAQAAAPALITAGVAYAYGISKQAVPEHKKVPKAKPLTK